MARTFRDRQKQGNDYGLHVIKGVYFRNQILKNDKIVTRCLEKTNKQTNKTKNFKLEWGCEDAHVSSAQENFVNHQRFYSRYSKQFIFIWPGCFDTVMVWISFKEGLENLKITANPEKTKSIKVEKLTTGKDLRSNIMSVKAFRRRTAFKVAFRTANSEADVLGSQSEIKDFLSWKCPRNIRFPLCGVRSDIFLFCCLLGSSSSRRDWASHSSTKITRVDTSNTTKSSETKCSTGWRSWFCDNDIAKGFWQR